MTTKIGQCCTARSPMADRRISELQEILASEVRADADVLALADISASETRKIKVAELAEAVADALPDGSLSGSVLEDGTVHGDKLQDGTVTGDKLADDTITADKIAPDSITSSELADGAVDTDAIQDDAVTGSKIADSALGRGIDKQADVIGHSEEYFPAAPTSFAGVTVDEYGHVSGFGTEIPATDLPIATDSDQRRLPLPARQQWPKRQRHWSGQPHQHRRPRSTARPKSLTTVTVTSPPATDLESADLPLATATEAWSGQRPGPTLSVDGNGALTHASSGVTPGSVPQGHSRRRRSRHCWSDLEASDIPDLSFDQITSGEIGEGVSRRECAVNAPNICDYATCLMQEDNPGRW